MNKPRDGIITAHGLTAEFRFIHGSTVNINKSKVDTAMGEAWVYDSMLAYDPLSPEPWNQPLFDHMSHNYNLTLLESEMDEIMIAVDQCRQNDAARHFQDLSPEAAAVVAGVGTERDWPEDFAHENGKYECRCVFCHEPFMGNKRRFICKLCDSNPAAVVAQAKEAPCKAIN